MTTREFIEKHEGRRDKPYKCTAGKNTIGVGWNMDANPLPKDIADYLKEYGHILDEHIDRLLTMSINTAERDCRKLFSTFDTFSPNRKMALTDWCFQLGLTTAKKFVNTIGMINRGKWKESAINMRKSNYYKQVPKRAEEVCRLLEKG
jgi:lysozyme